MSGLGFERLVPVAAGAATGAVARWGVFALVDSPSVALVVVNLLGTALLALLVGRWGHESARVRRLDFAATGFCGSLTSFSTLAVDLARRLGDGELGAVGVLLIVPLAVGTIVFVAGERLGGPS